MTHAIFNSPSEAPFARSLAASVLHGAFWNGGPAAPMDLPALTIYLPSLAAVEPLKLAFLALAPSRATFLPRIRVLGEADPLDLFAAFGSTAGRTGQDLLAQALAVPPAVPAMERRLALAGFVLKAAKAARSTKCDFGEPLFLNISPASAFGIAGRIVSLIGEAASEGADLGRLATLDGSDAAGGEQLSLRLLRAVLRDWAAAKRASGKADPEERRNRLMAIEAEFVRRSTAPVIVAGSTGSVGATLLLMRAVLSRKNGAVVLAGLDRCLDDASWAAVADHPEHPQHGLQQLLSRLGVSRDEVAELPVKRSGAAATRTLFLSEALRPASTAAKWRGFLDAAGAAGRGPACVEGISVIEAETLQEEADTVALILREALERKGQTAALITPDAKLAQRARHSLSRLGLSTPPDDGAGLAEMRFAASVARCAAAGSLEGFIALSRHAPGSNGALRRFAEVVDLGALRQIWRPAAFVDLPAAITHAFHAVSSSEARHPAMRAVAPDEWEAARQFAEGAVSCFGPMLEAPHRARPLSRWLSAHQEVLSRLALLGFGPASDQAAALPQLDEIARAIFPGMALDLAEYAALFTEMAGAAHRQAPPNPHPRLHILRPLDARLQAFDVAVLAGLNEGCWPANPEPDPLLGRRDRALVGLPPAERRIGQSAQDFAALTGGAPRVYLTRAKRIDGSLARPSRWLARIQALGAGHARALDPPQPWLIWARRQRAPLAVKPAAPPEPRPPLAARPRRLSVTAIETWLANPYAIYARYILRLEPVRRPEEHFRPADRGILIHAALHSFLEAYPDRLPANADSLLSEALERAALTAEFDLARAPFFRPRFARFARWFAEAEAERRSGVALLRSEVFGKLALSAPGGPFQITARADRIDLLEDGSWRIHDFKTSKDAAKQSLSRGAPQLALEGLLARNGGFARISPGSEATLAYVIASGGEPPGEEMLVKRPAEAIAKAEAGTLSLIARFDDAATPYRYEVRTIFKDRAKHDPYAHLARLGEWRSAGAGDD